MQVAFRMAIENIEIMQNVLLNTCSWEKQVRNKTGAQYSMLSPNYSKIINITRITMTKLFRFEYYDDYFAQYITDIHII